MVDDSQGQIGGPVRQTPRLDGHIGGDESPNEREPREQVIDLVLAHLLLCGDGIDIVRANGGRSGEVVPGLFGYVITNEEAVDLFGLGAGGVEAQVGDSVEALERREGVVKLLAGVSNGSTAAVHVRMGVRVVQDGVLRGEHADVKPELDRAVSPSDHSRGGIPRGGWLALALARADIHKFVEQSCAEPRVVEVARGGHRRWHQGGQEQ